MRALIARANVVKSNPNFNKISFATMLFEENQKIISGNILYASQKPVSTWIISAKIPIFSKLALNPKIMYDEF